MSIPSINANHSQTSMQKSTAQQSILQKLKSYKMYGQVFHQGEYSDQSSSINPSFESSLDRFKSSKQQISSVSLFNDLPLNLLQKPMFNEMEQQKTMVEMLFGDDNFNIFDSIVDDADIFDQQIVQARKYKQLLKEVQELEQYKEMQNNKLIELRGKNIAKRNVKQNMEEIDEIVQENWENQQLENQKKAEQGKKARTLREGFDSKLWFKYPQEFDKNRQLALDSTKKYFQKQIASIKAEILTLKKRKEEELLLSIEIEKSIKQIQQKTINRRFERKKQLMDEYIRKEEEQLRKLMASIAKMERILGKPS